MEALRPANILILKAAFYEDIAQLLEDGAVAALKEADASYEIIDVAGALEIPVALALAADAGLLPYGAPRWQYHGCVALGCVIRGETSHYEIVANDSARGLLDLAISRAIPFGNGVLTVENREQALVRARPDGVNKGGAAVKACLGLVGLRDKFNPSD
ncbi:6,7-dimethyl-8-ribityllumazine synthase 1 [bacterium MnTg02]|nr:6,7-dimethyl-8-ribityllumazine synthase 1 [bacterium MnTg02]